MTELNEETCCPKFDPKPWEDKTIEWKNKKFCKDKVFTLFYMPIGFGCKMKKLMRIFDSEKIKNPDNLMLCDHTSMWNMNIYISTDRIVSNLNNTTISGKFLSRVYEGPFKDAGKWHKDIVEYTKRKTGNDPKKVYYFYTTCPKCAKKYGKNYVVLLAQTV